MIIEQGIELKLSIYHLHLLNFMNEEERRISIPIFSSNNKIKNFFSEEKIKQIYEYSYGYSTLENINDEDYFNYYSIAVGELGLAPDSLKQITPYELLKIYEGRLSALEVFDNSLFLVLKKINNNDNEVIQFSKQKMITPEERYKLEQEFFN